MSWNSPDSAVSWWTTASGAASATARRTASASRASATTGRAPSARTSSRLAGDLVIPTTSCPRSTSWGTSRRPSAPVAPAMKTLMVLSFPIVSTGRRDGGAACDSGYQTTAPVTPQRVVCRDEHGSARLRDDGDGLVGLDGLALRDVQLAHRAGPVGGHLVLHLHRLDDADHVA